MARVLLDVFLAFLEGLDPIKIREQFLDPDRPEGRAGTAKTIHEPLVFLD